jgi:aminoglycoside phosphotransferase (APT) family kinase protein
MPALNLQVLVARESSELRTALAGWLADVLAWDGAVILTVERAVGTGSANETLLVNAARDDGATVPLVVRISVPGVEVFFDASLERQAAVISWVRSTTRVPVPTVLGLELTGDVLGAPFMVMERLQGCPAPDFPGYNVTGFLQQGSPAFRRAVWSDALDTMGALHTTGRGPVEVFGLWVGESGLLRLVEHWQATLRWIGERADVGVFEEPFDWLAASIPTNPPEGLSWGDARMANMLFVGERCTAVLDWEMASVGGPLNDLAWWLLFDEIQSTDLGVARLEGLAGRTETIDRWEARTGHPTDALPWHEVFAHLRLAMTRANVFAQRQAMGLEVPSDDDPRSVRRLLDRIDRMLGC